MILRDHLALDRTTLANERTVLAYIRTAIALFVTGMSLVHFFQGQLAYIWIGIVLTALSALVALLGLIRFFLMRAALQTLLMDNDDKETSPQKMIPINE